MKKIIKKIKRYHWVIAIAFVFTAGAIGFGFWYGYTRLSAISLQLSNLSAEVNSLDLKFASTTVLLKENITETQTSFSASLQQEKRNITEIKKQFGGVLDEVSSISGAVNTLEKLSKTDPELLQKYSKVFFLNEYYEPTRLVEVPDKYKYNEQKNIQIHNIVWLYLKSMLENAQQNNIDIFISSAYRSFNTQTALKNGYDILYGAGTANQFSAAQGYSEHQLGTTVDLITTGINGTLPGFEKTDAYTWLLGNAYKYGFILSYPKDNNFYIFEPWHWRFVGVKLATDLRNTNKQFYEMDQREIDEYLANMFD